MIPYSVSFTSPNFVNSGNKIALIRAIRKYSGLGLKDAKEMAEQEGTVNVRARYFSSEDTYNLILEGYHELRETTFNFKDAESSSYFLKKAVGAAINEQNFQLVSAIGDLLAKESQ